MTFMELIEQIMIAVDLKQHFVNIYVDLRKACIHLQKIKDLKNTRTTVGF